MRVGRKVLGFKSVDGWEREIVDGIVSKKEVSKVQYQDIKGNFSRKSVGSFW